MHRLQHPYPSVIKGEICSFGGNQVWSGRWDLRKYGCGAVAMTDLILYLTRHHGVDGPKEATLDPIPLADYDRLCSRLQRRYLTMIPPSGINGLSLAAGISLYCTIHRIPLRAFWGVRTGRLWSAVSEMLDRDLPVILAAGPNFPAVWQKHKLKLYRKTPDGTYVAVSGAAGHYMTVTAMDDTWLTVSSWGKQYWIHRGEYEAYGRSHSIPLVNNILFLRQQT